MQIGVGVGVGFSSFRGSAAAAAHFAAATVIQQNTTASNDLTEDGYTWGQGNPEVVDQFGKRIAFIQQNRSGDKRHLPIVSNNDGTTWIEPTRTGFQSAEGETALGRGAIDIDTVNDTLHAFWTLGQAAGSVIWRAYKIVRDGSNNITGFTRTHSVQMEVGVSGMSFEFPICLCIGATVLGGWSARNPAAATTKIEYRLTGRVFTDTTADDSSANWFAPLRENAGAGAADAVSSSGVWKYSSLAKSAFDGDICLALLRKSAGAPTHANDLHWFYVSNGSIRANYATWSAANSDWRGGVGVAIANDVGTVLTALTRAGTDTGYYLKSQLLVKIVEDTISNKIKSALSTWKDDTDGDTWSIIGLDGSDNVLPILDVYKAGSANTNLTGPQVRIMFVAGDIMFDPNTGYTIASYGDLPRHDTYVSSYADTVPVDTAFLVWNTQPFDIPTLAPKRNAAGNICITGANRNAAARNNPPTYTPPYIGFHMKIPLT